MEVNTRCCLKKTTLYIIYHTVFLIKLEKIKQIDETLLEKERNTVTLEFQIYIKYIHLYNLDILDK